MEVMRLWIKQKQPSRLKNNKVNYREYITSSEWRSKHKDFLKASHYRCAFFPWVKVGKKRRYNVHHMNYDRLGEEVLWEDVICVHPWIHRWILTAS